MPIVDGKVVPLKLPPKHARVIYDNSKKWRYRVMYGGRNGGKDWSFASAAIEMAIRKETRFLFTREVQKTLDSSARQLLVDTIKRLGYKDLFDVTKNEIRCERTGSIIKFNGLNDLVSEDLKSFEAIDFCVICEAQNLTRKSMTDLDPTIRKPGSEIWIMFNPQYADDFVYEFCVTNKPDNMICEQVNYTDLPAQWISQEVLDQAERSCSMSKSDYDHIWLGKCKAIGGKVWTTFDRNEMVLSEGHRHLERYTFAAIACDDNACDCFMGMDPHSQYYPACVWVARFNAKHVEDDVFVVYNEWPKHADLGDYYSTLRKTLYYTGSIADLGGAIRSNDVARHVRGRFLDTRYGLGAGAATMWSTSTAGICEQLSKAENGGLKFAMPSVKNIDVQRGRIRGLMQWNRTVPISVLNQARLYVMPHCLNMIQSLTAHRFEDSTEREDDRYKDFSDALRICFAGIDETPRQYSEHREPTVEEGYPWAGFSGEYQTDAYAGAHAGCSNTSSWLGY